MKKTMKNSFLLISLFILQGIVTNANASILIEPHFGLNVTGGGTNGAYEYSYNGTQIGLKFGGQYLGFMAGLDYNVSSYTWERKSTSATYNDSFDRTEIGVFAGYNLPILLRAWAGYYFSNKATDQDSSGLTANGYKYEGGTTELGVGFTGLPFLSLNLIYRMISIDKSINTSGVDTSTTIDNHEVLLGISAPFTLL